MDILRIGIFLPYLQIRLYGNFFDSIQCYHVKFPDRFIVLRRVSRCHDDPSLRYLMGSEGFALKKLQHGRSQCLRYAVDLVDKKDPFLKPCIADPVIHRSHNFAHCVLRHRIFLSSVNLMFNKRKTHGALPCMVGNGIGNQTQTAFSGNLLHNLGFSHSRRADQKHRPLADGGDHIFSAVIL